MGDEENFQSFEEFSKTYTLEDIVLTIFLLPQAEFLSSSPPKKRLLVIPWLPPGQEQIQHEGSRSENCDSQSFWRRPATDINPAFSVAGHFSLFLFHKFVRNVALWHIFEGAWNIIKSKHLSYFSCFRRDCYLSTTTAPASGCGGRKYRDRWPNSAPWPLHASSEACHNIQRLTRLRKKFHCKGNWA